MYGYPFFLLQDRHINKVVQSRYETADINIIYCSCFSVYRLFREFKIITSVYLYMVYKGIRRDDRHDFTIRDVCVNSTYG